ncbi:MAG: methyltransferase domain-containing protein [Lachnospiraceae bacterium]|nr:methyltransferase domain-containing protein [Lachnospiraceae bacterium]MDD3617305.1 methyltransferase domain-containing protein [Lachnospiraceae bacterium]
MGTQIVKEQIIEEQLMEEIDEYWTNRAEGYSKVNKEELATRQKEKWLKVIQEKIHGHFPDRVAEELKVLDIGTGPGFFAIIMANAGYQVTAVDYTQAMLEEAKENAGDLADKITFLQMDGQQLEFEEESFDVIISRNLTWVLKAPDQAYSSWRKVLKTGGLMLNFDANWYNYLYDDEKKAAYEQDRAKVEEIGVEDHYTCTDIDAMEEIAKKVPLSKALRPAWDMKVLKKLNMQKVDVDTNVWNRVWSPVEKVNYASTPMFMVAAQK